MGRISNELLTEAANISSIKCEVPIRDKTVVPRLTALITGPITVASVLIRILAQPSSRFRYVEMMDDWVMVANAVRGWA